jgi:dihydrodipicolinate synthase/N-acetylneuraminate lyase
MVWPQLAGENFQLTKEERIRGMEVICKAAKGKKAAIVLGVQGPNLRAAIAYLEKAEALDPDALIALPPTEAKSIDEWREYYKTLARSTKRPLFIQNAIAGGSNLKPGIDVLVELAREYPNCAYFKEEIKPEIERQLELARHRPIVKRVFTGGGGRNLLYVLRLALDGVMAGNAYADVCVDIWDLWGAGKQEKARDVYSKLLLVLACEAHIEGTREYMMKRRGVFKTMVSRRKDLTINAEEIKEIEFNLEGLKPYLRA